MSPELQASRRGRSTLRRCAGKLDEVALYTSCVWNPEEATSMLPTIDWETARKASKLHLNFRDTTIEVSDRRKSVNMGRADDNDLVVKGNLISRIHAKIEMRRGKFMLVDQSTNGTFLQNLQGEEIFVRRDSAPSSAARARSVWGAPKPGLATRDSLQNVEE